MKMEISEFGPFTVVKPCDKRLDAPSAVAFKATMRSVSDGGAQHIVLDMSRIDFLDSSGLGALIAVLKHLSPDTKIEVAGLTPAVRKVFYLTRMEHAFKVYTTIDQAVPDDKRRAG